MSDTNASRFSEVVLRRRLEPFNFFGHPLSPDWWLVLLAVVLIAAFFYVGWMYLKDSRSVGPWWATFLGLLRTTVYVVLAAVFLLPSEQNWEEVRSHSSVAVAFDVSKSLGVIDDIPTGKPGEVLPTRQDKVLEFLKEKKFLPELAAKNPTTVYRFTDSLDDNFFHVDGDKEYTREEWTTAQNQAAVVQAGPKMVSRSADDWATTWTVRSLLMVLVALALIYAFWRFARDTQADNPAGAGLAVRVALITVVGLFCVWLGFLRTTLVPDPDAEEQAEAQPAVARVTGQPLGEEFRLVFLKPLDKIEDPARPTALTLERLKDLRAHNARLDKRKFFDATKVPESVLAVVAREQNNRSQGIVVFTDGRSTAGDSQAFERLHKRALAAKIPIFVVGVGEIRPQVHLEIVDLRVPVQVKPEDKFRVVLEVTGKGLPGKPVENLEMVLTHPSRTPDGKEVLLPIFLSEVDKSKKPDDKTKPTPKFEPMLINLGTKLVLKPTPKDEKTKVPTFDHGATPRARIEYQIDVPTLAAAAKVDLTDPKYKGKEWELGVTKPTQELRFEAKLGKHPLDVMARVERLVAKADLPVVKKPLRVLLFASAPTRDYQFLRTLLVRESDKKWLDLTIYLQPPPGRTERRMGIVQDVPKERLLQDFPVRYDPRSEKEDDLDNLANYDVIVAFDPDWTQLTKKQLESVSHWVNGTEPEKTGGKDPKKSGSTTTQEGGGLIALGGPINTLHLARPGADQDKLKPIISLYPVVLRDFRLDEIERDAKDPWPLNFDGATPEMEFLKLEEGEKAPKFLEDWQAFFYGEPREGEEKKPLRGFYNYYPVEKVLPSRGLVVARFTDPRAKLKDRSEQPYIVITPPGSSKRVVWIGSGETWRLRQYREAYHERFWTKLLRYAGANHHRKTKSRIQLDMSKSYVANKVIEIEARVEGVKAGQDPEITLTLPTDIKPEDKIETKYVMKEKRGESNKGVYWAKFQPRREGEYTLELKVPGTTDVVRQKFTVREDRPEEENTQPDFDAMYVLASEAEEVLKRMNDADAREVQKSLAPPRLSAESKSDKPRLFFTLANAHLIPKCMLALEKSDRNLLPYKDLWDDGWVVKEGDPKATPPRKPVKISWVLMGIVGLLSVEWLTRKLLRLA